MQTDPIDSDKKICKMCCMPIPKDARKCPCCQHFQNRLTLLLYHPAFAVLALMIPWFMAIFALASVFDTGKEYATYKDQIAVSESEIAFGDTKSGATIAVIGTIKNTSPVSWKEIGFHVDFFDASGVRTDVGEREDYNFRLPANGTSSFKISFRREFPETNYVKHAIRVTSAKDARARW